MLTAASDRAVVDPEVPDRDRRVLRSVPDDLLPSADGTRAAQSTPAERQRRAQVAQARQDRKIHWPFGPVAAGLMAVTCAALWNMGRGIPDLEPSWLPTATLIGAVLFALGSVCMTVSRRLDTQCRRVAARYRNRYVCPCDLQRDQRKLVIRAATAVDTVMESEAHRRDLVDRLRNDAELPHTLWKIAQDAVKIDTLARKYRSTLDESAGSEVDAVLATRAVALYESLRAVDERVKALEKYAAKVHKLDNLMAQRQQLEDLEKETDVYLDLVAQTTADTATVQNLYSSLREAEGMSGPLADAVRVARGAAALALPADARTTR